MNFIQSLPQCDPLEGQPNHSLLQDPGKTGITMSGQMNTLFCEHGWPSINT